MPLLLDLYPSDLSQPKLRQRLHDLHGFDAERDDALEQVDDVARLVVLVAPEVGVVDDAALFVGGDGVALHDPLDGVKKLRASDVNFSSGASGMSSA